MDFRLCIFNILNAFASLYIGILPNKIEPTDFKIIAQNLPKRIYEDLLKEELELVKACGEFGGKICAIICMNIAKELILGK